MRIDKYISECGAATRREAQAAARRGGVTVNGVPVRDLSQHIDEASAEVVYLGVRLVYRKYTYVMLNKPEGYVSATDDKSLPYVTELLTEELRRMELFPVGRLDKDTTGLMILTNNGPLAHALLSPKRHVEKRYIMRCAEPLVTGAEEEFFRGVTLRDGYECKSARLVCDEDRSGGEITLTEGKYHQIKRMVGAMGNRVTSLMRVSFGPIALDGSLAAGEWRYLTDAEISALENHRK